MEELDPIIRDLGASAIALRPQESCSCTSHALKYNSNMGLLIILTLVLMLAAQKILIWPTTLSLLLTITVSAPFAYIKKRSK